MLSIPVKLDLDAGAATAALKDFERGAKEALGELVELNGKKVNIDFKFSTSGEPIVKELNDQEAALKKVTDGYNKLTGGQAKSIGRTKKIIQQFRAERDALAANSKEYKDAEAVVKKFEQRLRQLQGVQGGSIAEIKAQRAELVSLRNAARINSPEFNKLTKEIRKFDRQLAASKVNGSSFVQAFAKIAVVSAGIQAVGSALRSVGNAIDVFVRRTKDVEGFNLALRNAGLEQSEVNRVFQQAETTANALGAPLAQVEKTYKRMIPALQAVGTSSADSDKFIEQISARTQTLGLNTEQSGRLLEAFAQVLSKGKLQAEELNQQISELDGAFRTQFAEALGVSTAELNDLISSSKITADVFVETVNKMSNGAEQLKKRIKDGTATIQQFQNQITNIDTKNIEAIGKAIQPAVKSFLQIRLAVAEFIQSFSQSAQFELLVNIFNSIAKGAEEFAKALLNVIGVIGQLLSPLVRVVDFVLTLDAGIGNLVTLLIKAAAAITTLVLAIKAYNKLATGVQFVVQQFTNLSAAITGNGVAAQKSGPTIARYGDSVKKTGFAAASTAGKLKMLGKAAAKLGLVFAAISAIDNMIGSFRAAGEAAEKMNARFSDVKLDFKDKLEELNQELDKTPANTEKLADSLKNSSDKAEAFGRANQAAGFTLGGLAIAAAATAATVLSGGAALGVYAGAAGLAAIASNRFNAAKKQLDKTGSGRAFLKNQKEIGDMIKANVKEIEKLGATVGQVDFSNFANAGDDVTDLSRRYRAQANAIKGNIASLQNLIKEEESKKDGDENLIAAAKAKIEVQRQDLALVERSANAASAFVTELLRQGDASAEAAVSTAELAKATKLFVAEVDTEAVNAQTEAIKRYGKEANSAELLAAANTGIAAAATEKKIELYDREIQKLIEKNEVEGVLNEEDRKRLTELTALTAQESQKQAQLGIQARNQVVDAFEKGIEKVNQKVQIIGQSTQGLRGAFDGVANSFVSGLQAAGGLIDEIVQREIEGLEVGSQKRKDIIREQLIAQGQASETEAQIASLKIKVQSKIAQSEARISQLRLRTEAAVARARGQKGLAQELEKAAGLQNQVIEALKIQERIDLNVVELNKQKVQQGLIAKGQQEELGTTAKQVADQIGVEVVSRREAIEAQKSLTKEMENYSKKLADMTTNSQKFKEATAETAFDEGVRSAEEVKDAIAEANTEAGNLNTAMSNANDAFQAVKGSGDQIVRTLQSAVSEAQKLISITGGSNARAMGGPVTAGQQYTVNDGGGREAFLSNSGKFSMLPAARNIQWTAPSSGTIISAQVLKAMQRNQRHDTAITNAKTIQAPRPTAVVSSAVSSDSGSLAKQISNAMSGSTSSRITNNVTIQSQNPVNDASDLMTNVARMRLRNSRSF